MTYANWEQTELDGGIMHWDDVRLDPGNNYDNETGAYTAPYDGYYQFSITKRTAGYSSSFLTLVDGVSIHNCFDLPHDQSRSQSSCTVVIKLLAGQRVQIRIFSGTVIQSLQTKEVGRGSTHGLRVTCYISFVKRYADMNNKYSYLVPFVFVLEKLEC